MVSDEAEFSQRMQRIETLIAEIDSLGGDGRLPAKAAELVSLVMDLHGTGFRRMMELLEQAGPRAAAVVNDFAQDSLIASLLVLYDLHPEDLATRVNRGLDAARPYLESHGGNVELVSLDEGRAVLRLQGNCHGCPSSALTMKNAIEEAIYEHAPDLAAVEVEQADSGVPPIAGFVSLDSLSKCST
jgi:Fe-S cluster biogenesis protein NfuA